MRAGSADDNRRRPVLWLVTPVHGRPSLTRVCLEQRARVLLELAGHGIDARALVVGQGENVETARELGLETLERPNELGRKLNDGIEWACREGGADFVSFVGSDDWVLAEYLADLPAPGRVRTARWVAYVAPDASRLVVLEVPGPLGSAPWIMPRDLLEPAGYRPAPEHRSSGMDYGIADTLLPPWPARARARHATFEHADADKLRLVDFKSPAGPQLHPWGALSPTGATRRETDEVWATLATRYPADLCARMEELYSP